VARKAAKHEYAGVAESRTEQDELGVTKSNLRWEIQHLAIFPLHASDIRHALILRSLRSILVDPNLLPTRLT
jgi:hypothetical protein